MADHSKPILTSTYANFVSELDARMDDLAVGLDPAVTTVTNPPNNAIRWTSASKTWQKWSGSAWVALTDEFSFPGIVSQYLSVSRSSILTTATIVNSGTGYALEAVGDVVVTNGIVRSARSGVPGQYVEFRSKTSSGSALFSFSPSSDAKNLYIGATTDGSNTTPTVGTCSVIISSLGVTKVTIGASGLTVSDNLIVKQVTPSTVSTTSTLTTAAVLNRIVQSSPSAAIILTQPTGALLDAAVQGLSPNEAIDWSVINTGTFTATIAASSGITVVGNMAVTAGTSGMFRTRKTATSTFITYRVA